MTASDRAREARSAGPDVFRFAATGAIASAIFFVLCWAGAMLPIGPASHMYVQLFTQAAIPSAAALAEGLCWAIVLGAIAGALIAGVYRLLTPIGRG